VFFSKEKGGGGGVIQGKIDFGGKGGKNARMSFFSVQKKKKKRKRIPSRVHIAETRGRGGGSNHFGRKRGESDEEMALCFPARRSFIGRGRKEGASRATAIGGKETEKSKILGEEERGKLARY